jgi:large subunit ribosomal protein L16
MVLWELKFGFLIKIFMLRPKKVKYNKARKIRIKRMEYRQNNVVFGSYGLKTLDGGKISSRQIEAVRRVIVRKLKRTGKLWIRVFPNVPITAKPNEVRMGRGKGSVDQWVGVVKPGTIIYEIGSTKESLAQKALMSGAKKLSMKCAFVTR